MALWLFGFVKSCDKLKTSIPHNIYGHQTCESGDTPGISPTRKVT